MHYGDNGILGKNQIAKREIDKAEEKENIILENYEDIINDYLISSNRDEKCEHISKDIENFTPNIDYINGTYITISIAEIKTLNSVEIVGYIFLLNNKVKAVTTENTYTFNNLDFDTLYNFSVIVIDENAKLKSSEISAKTLNKLYLYNEGNECNFITDGWKQSGYHVKNNGTLTKNTDNIYLYSPNGSRIYCSHQKPIDLTNYSKLYIEIEGTQKVCAISTISYFSNSYGTDINIDNMVPIDISEYKGNYYIHLTNANGGYSNIKNVWLEK